MPTPPFTTTATELPLTDVVVRQLAGQRLQVLAAATGLATQGVSAVGVLAVHPLTLSNGGPLVGNFPQGNIYTVTANHQGQPVEVTGVRYLGLTPDGNAQFTTE